MNPYPNSGDPNQPNQYPPSQGLTGTPYGSGAPIPPNPPAYGDQFPYQQGAYQQPSYQTPYQSPYQQTPYPQSKSTIAFDWRYLTAGIGALVALIAFFLPYYTYGSGGGSYYGITVPSTNYSVTGLQIGRQFLLDVIIALAAIIIALLLQFGNQMFKASTSPNIQKLANSLNTQTRAWGLVLLIIGAFGIFFRFILDLTVLNIWGVGSWLYLLGMAAVTVGGFFVFRPLNSTPTQVPPVR
jgi:hypothetical protein